MNRLWFGDNLGILRDHVGDESVDLVYLDPPFNSKANYNVLFRTPDDDAASAQVEAFRDTWSWGEEAQWSLDEIMRSGGDVATLIRALSSALGKSDMMAYLVMMAQRLAELRRVLKPTGSLYLHCDPTASHYLKIILDAVFGPTRFRNEIVWQRSMSKSLSTRRLPTNHDVILGYGLDGATWNADAMFVPYDTEDLPESVAAKYTRRDGDGRLYQLTSLINPNSDRPNLTYEFMGVTRVWRWTRERMEQALAEGMIEQTAPGRVPRFRRYLDEQRGMPLSDVWTDLPPLNSQAAERLGYPTQKPRALLDRILRLSSTEEQVVLDPFCGCGTTIEAAARLGRHWIGIDVAYHAIGLVEDRLAALPQDVDYVVDGIPRDLPSAYALAERDKFQFQWWANYLVGVQALREVRKGPDRGIDGQMFFMNGPRGWGRILTSVKGGRHVGVKDIREFRAVIDREAAEMGLFICLGSPTREMAREAAGLGFVSTAHGHLPRLQIVSVEEWFEGKRPTLPTLAHVAREWFQPKSQKPKSGSKARKIDPTAPEFPFSFTGGGSKSDKVVHFNPAQVRRQMEAG
ncbi:MAG: site-specific DNA-methyltransferase [Oricola sp.]|nr:MAG: site-specific DNA-methyltransferase [Oricola sp.]